MKYCYQMANNGQVARVLDVPHTPRYLHELCAEIRSIAQETGDIELPAEEVSIRFIDYTGDSILMYYDSVLEMLSRGEGWGKWFHNKPGKMVFSHLNEEKPFMQTRLTRCDIPKMLVWEIEYLNGVRYGEMAYIHDKLLQLGGLVLDEDVYRHLC